jgi:hypothetical protein
VATNFLLHRFKVGSGAHPLGIEVCFPRVKAIGAMKLTTHLHLVPMLRMRGAMPPFMAWRLIKYTDRIYRARVLGIWQVLGSSSGPETYYHYFGFFVVFSSHLRKMPREATTVALHVISNFKYKKIYG